MNFVNADISDVAHAIGLAVGQTIIVDPRVKGQLNILSDNPVSDEEALKILESSLRMQGFTFLHDHGVFKVVPEADAKLQGVPTFVGPYPPAHGDQVITQIFQLRRASANSVLPILRPLISPNNTISVDQNNNTVVITDYADNIKRIASILASLESASQSNAAHVQLNFADASVVAQQVQKLFDVSNNSGSDPSQKISVLADARTNAILLRGSSATRVGEAENLVVGLDTPTHVPGNIHIVSLRNADASDLARTLRSILGQSGSSGSKGGAGSESINDSRSSNFTDSGGALPPLPSGTTGSTGGSTSGLLSSAASSTAATSAMSGGSTGSNNRDANERDGGEIVADLSTNSLIITAPEPVFNRLAMVISRLDQRKTQVYIESLIAEISSDKEGQFGIEWLTASGLAAVNASTTNVGLVAGFGNILGTKGLFQALQSSSDVNVLSTPSLVTLNNHEARILVGTNVPIESGSYSTGTTSTSSVNAFNTYDRKDVGVLLNVRPQINQGGTIKLQIYQEDSSVENSTANQAGGYTIDKRYLQTTVLADNGQIVVLGGLISDNYTNGNSRIPWLSKIPVLGALFTSETKSRKKTNLLIFLRPVIIKDEQALRDISSSRYGYVRKSMSDYQTENRFEQDNHVPVPSPYDVPQQDNLIDTTRARPAVPGASDNDSRWAP
ncbi:general secretion pathway protein D [Paraburkholderia phenoliruptrix]|uniref:secretin N-terminal domain-containing protein n=1 Tax=Paraburkholderia phenoliruptrix TaxID=252970 RepID=UPI002854546C|nr:secretin N-terminal domain-containing protein [Paraburkholderia phenoliruptrix]MDR6422613.1 general secretion pathway protein D [Paraburkholderia phenoliruptrix]